MEHVHPHTTIVRGRAGRRVEVRSTTAMRMPGPVPARPSRLSASR